MKNNFFPLISIIIPTFNSGEFLGECLGAIANQDYPREKVELIVVDGGSSDNTLAVAKKYGAKILSNKDTVEELGKPLGIKEAKGEILGFLDADNILSGNNFLKSIVEPFADIRIVVSEPLFYASRGKDNLFTKYISLIGGDDPISIYLGIFDRFCFFKNRWTESLVTVMKKENYWEVDLNARHLPPMGANGSFFRSAALKKINYSPFLHTDIIFRLVWEGMNRTAKVKVGIIHLQKPNFFIFIKKKIRRLKRYFLEEIKRDYPLKVTRKRLFFASLWIFLIIPMIYDSLKGMIRKPSFVWFLHPIFTLALFWVNVFYYFKYRFLKKSYV